MAGKCRQISFCKAFQKLWGLLGISLRDAQQLQRVPLILSLAPSVTQLSVTCGGCPDIPASWPTWPHAPQIRQLGLAYFHLKTLPEDAFGNFTGLELLGLQYNHLETLPEKIFQNLTALDNLYLNDNHLETLPEKIFQNLTSLHFLRLQNNPGLKRPAACDSGTIYCLGP